MNAAGLKSKLNSFKKVIYDLQPSIFFIQETKYKTTGRFKIENFEIFELVRTNKSGGGLAIGCQKELKPVWMREGNDEVEALSIEIVLKDIKIRCVVAYGCQESDLNDRKESFWQYLDEDVQQAAIAGSGFILQFDGNLWAGNDIIPDDPNKQNRNGKLFQEFLERHPQLSVVNKLPLCEGLITRMRNKNNKIERSVLDFFVVCERVLPFVVKMHIDESKKFILTNYASAKNGGQAKDTDHFTQYLDLNLKVEREKPERIEIYDFKNIDGQKMFKKLTTDTKQFTDCFNNMHPLSQQIKMWRKTLETFCQRAFRKIRIRKRSMKPLNSTMAKLINLRNKLRKNKGASIEIDCLNEMIADEEAKINREKIVGNFKQLSEDPERINLQSMWKKMKKLWPKEGVTVPTAKRNHKGKIVSGPREIKEVLAKEYKDRLRSRPIRPDLKDMDERKNKIFDMKLKIAEDNPSQDWNMGDLEKALADLKNNKSRDFEGLINEIFKEKVIGTDLKHSLLIMFNLLKAKKMIPAFMNSANITTVPKKGSRIEPKNERGIFRVSVVRSILMRLIYNMKYPIIDQNMSDCQMGGRKKKSCTNNIFVVNGIIHETLKKENSSPICLQIYDYSQMFDTINLKQALSDLYDAGVVDDTLKLLYEANKDINMAVKTPSGLTDRQVINNSVLQGDTWGSLLASVQVENIGKDCLQAGHFLLYKDRLPVGFLGLIDDIVGITKTGIDAQKMNSFINLKTAEKGLRFGVSKCKTMVIGEVENCYVCNEEFMNRKHQRDHMKKEHVTRGSNECKVCYIKFNCIKALRDHIKCYHKNTERNDKNNITKYDLMVDEWSVNYVECSKTGEVELTEHFVGQTKIENIQTQKYLGFVLSSTGDNMANIDAIKKKSIGLVKTAFNKLNSLNLKFYYFECSAIILNVMLRSSILYASEVYYELQENEIRQLERIEEQFMRKILNTTKGCPIVSLYLSLGHIPARFEIQKRRLLFLKYILTEKEDSMVRQFFQLQTEVPTKGDWASSCLKDLKDLEIFSSLKEIERMPYNQFKNILKKKIKEKALTYLMNKIRKKGKEINYKELSMAEYLLPENRNLSIVEKQKIFEMQNKMTNIPSNFSKSDEKHDCFCGSKETMNHIYYCRILNNGEEQMLEYDKIYNGKVSEQKDILKIFGRKSQFFKF